MGQVLLAFVVGLVFGSICSFARIPIPAPPNLAGVMGIVGVFVGFITVKNIVL